MADLSRGVLFVATGERYVAEAAVSAVSIRQHMPALPILLYTDHQPAAGHPFDEIRLIANPQHLFVDKVHPLADSPFERTLFLDTDTFVCADLSDVFALLDRFDLALAHAPMRHDRPYPTPNCFAEMNSGVIAYRMNDRVRAMFRHWLAIYDQDIATSAQPEYGDQVHLRRAIYESEASLYILPPEYNYRSVVPGFIARQKVRIIHGRGDLAAIAEQLNASNAMRTTYPSLDQFNRDQAIFLDRPGQFFIRACDVILRAAQSLKKLFTASR